jgi:hypothetical protein
MRILTRLLLFTGVVLHPALARCDIINRDFETGDLTGWQLSITPASHPLFNPAYPFPLETSPLGRQVWVGAGFGNDGSYGVEVLNRQYITGGSFTGPDSNQYSLWPQYYTLSIYQDLSLSAGSVVTGWARFGSGDYPGFTDNASVTCDAATVWHYDLNMLDNSGVWTDGPWQSWQFVAPSDGIYRLSLNVYGDDHLNSAGYFDNIQVVPEPTAAQFLELVGGALMTLGVICRRK